MSTAYLPYGLLALTHLTLLLGQEKLSSLVFALALSTALYLERVSWPGVGLILLFAALAYAMKRLQARPASTLYGFVTGVFALVALAFLSHKIPGFQNLVVLDAHRFTVDSQPFTMYLNFDKPLVFTFGFLLMRPKGLAQSPLRTLLLATLASACILLVPAFAMSYVRLDPKLAPETLLWALNNFFFVCAAEEMLFRGILQNELAHWLKRERLALTIAAVLFGLIHFHGGVPYVFLATLAGLVYGEAYRRTGRIDVAMGVHFLVNLLHILFFSYPSLVTT